MMEAAEAGEFMGLDSLKNQNPPKADAGLDASEVHEEPAPSSFARPRYARQALNYRIPPRSPFKYQSPNVSPRNSAQNQAAMAWEAQEEAASGEGEMSTDERIREMIIQKKEIEATTLFMSLTPPPPGEFISGGRRELGCQLFAANCTRRNIYIARSLFERLEKWTYIDSELWAMMMHVLAMEGHVESVGRIYDKYWERLNVPAHLLEVVLRCLLESRRLASAKWLFYNRLKFDEGGGLCGAYLDGLWRKTRKIELLVEEFRSIMTRLIKLKRKPTEKVFNPLLKSFIETGKFEDAEILVRDMPEKWDVQPGCRTLGLLVYGRALQCDWDGVISGFREMHSRGLTEEKRNFAHVFDRVWLEYYPSHSGREIYDFLIGCMTEFEIKPDRVLHMHILEALIERGDAEMVEQISRMSETQQWGSGINEDDVVRITKARRISMEESPVGLWRMIQAARTQHGLVATSRRLMGSSAASYTLERDILAPIHLNAKESYPVSLNNLAAKRSVDVYIPLHKRMEQAIHAGRFADALSTFRHAEINGHPLKAVHIQLAVVAVLLDNGRDGLQEAKDLIMKCWTFWFKLPVTRYTPPVPKFMPIFFHQVMQLKRYMCHNSTVYKLALFEFYNICAEKPTLTVKNHAPVTIARRLISKSRPGAITATRVLEALYLSKWRKTHGFDQVQLKMLLRAYARVHNPRGVWWCILTVLSRHEPISRDFCAEVRRVMPGLEKELAELDEKVDFPNAYNIAVLKQVAQVLEKKASGDPHWSRFQADLEHKSKVRAQPVIRDRGDLNFLPSAESLDKVITEFDEEMEFDLLVRGQPSGDPGLLEQFWDERVVPFQQRTLPESPNYPGLMFKVQA